MISIPKRLRKLSALADRDLIARGLKLSEECGELSAEVLRYHGLKGTNGKSKAEVLDNLRLEAVDCLIMALDILVHTKTSKAQINKIMRSQLSKWEKQCNEKKTRSKKNANNNYSTILIG